MAAAVKHQSPDSNNQRESKKLKKLLKLINTQIVKQEPEVNQSASGQNKPVGVDLLNEEVEALRQFCLTYESERQFSKHQQSKLFSALFVAVLEKRINNDDLWSKNLPGENVFGILQLVRILLRDPTYRKQMICLDMIGVLSEHLNSLTDDYLSYVDRPFTVEILCELISIFSKLLSQDGVSEQVLSHGVHESLVKLLSAPDIIILEHTLRTLIVLVQSSPSHKVLCQLDLVDPLLNIIQDLDEASKTLAANLLRYLCSDPQTKETIKVYDGIPILLNTLQSDSVVLLKYTVWCLVQLSEDPDVKNIIRRRGGVPLLLGILSSNKHLSDEVNSTTQEASTIRQTVSKDSKEQYLALKSGCCACLTELILCDTNAQQIVQSNGIYCIGRLILPGNGQDTAQQATHHLQASAFRALRFLFSMEKNRQLFKRLFPPELFEKFIDVGSYNKDFSVYMPLVDIINKLSPEAIKEIEDNLESANHNREPTRTVNEYSVLELLGAGSYGSVYKVKKCSSEAVFAMKEINTQNAMWGASTKERQKSVGDVINELTIIREQLKHPNVVRYYKTFRQQDHLYIVMELIEGASLGEHFNSLKEKNAHFSEDRIWNIFVQLVSALRYLHKEKHIVHRDLTPNNIMLGEGDKVTITDFGLAKVKQADCSKMMSQVGTMLYWGPELILNKPYGEKADVWAIGCILYQMCTLKPPFYSNILSLAVKIVNADYEPIPGDLYSERVISTVKCCITVDVEKRPDIIGVASHISDTLLLHMDQLQRQNAQMERKLEHERNRIKMHKTVVNQSTPPHQLYLVSQESYDKLIKSPSSSDQVSNKESGQASDLILCSLESGHLKTDVGGATMNQQQNETGRPRRNSIENGWVTDEDACSSSSDSTSRVSSAGHCGRTESSQTRANKLQQKTVDNLQQLTVEIPFAKHSRDSGISSGDPSPTALSPMDYVVMDTVCEGTASPNRLQSFHSGLGSPTLESIGRRAVRSRPSSATTPTLAISQRRVREINDPILQILHQLHKIIYITQLPPTLTPNPRRKVIERYKRALFAPRSTPINLKNEMRKLLTGSCDVIDINLGSLNLHTTAKNPEARKKTDYCQLNDDAYLDAGSEIGITYEQLRNAIERVLMETGYYDLMSALRHGTKSASPLRSLSLPSPS